MPYADELSFALEAAEEAARFAYSRFGGDLDATLKRDGTWATEADLDTESQLRRAIAGRYPDHNILGEEEGLTSASGGEPVSGAPTWVIDPIDGTNNFMAGIPIWATLLGLRVDDETVVGICVAPALGETYDAALGLGARMNSNTIRVSEVEQLSDAFVLHAGIHRYYGTAYEDGLRKMIEGGRRDRGFGDFWGHVLVARGAAEVMVEPDLSIWDLAALQPIVTEAGGRVTAIEGATWNDGDSVLTTNGLLHEVIRNLYR